MASRTVETSSRAVVQWDRGGAWALEEITLDPPRTGEVRVRVMAAGLCHTDQTFANGGYASLRRPMIAGHEGAGVVEEVGPGVKSLTPGDHVLFCIPVPACGICHACLKGMAYFCEEGRHTVDGMQVSDFTSRHHARGLDLSLFVFLGTFADHTVVSQLSCLKIDPSLSFRDACTIGCAGVTGWGAVQNTGHVEPGDSVVVVGVGGVGANALMAARFLGAKDVIAVDPLASRREMAATFGADHSVASMDEARDLVNSLTSGRMAELVIMSMGLGDGSQLATSLSLLGKRGRAVIVNVHPEKESTATVSLNNVQSMEHQILGCFSGSWHGREGATFLLELQRRGLYNPGLLVSRTYTLEAIDEGYADQAAGLCVRAVVINDA